MLCAVLGCTRSARLAQDARACLPPCPKHMSPADVFSSALRCLVETSSVPCFATAIVRMLLMPGCCRLLLLRTCLAAACVGAVGVMTHASIVLMLRPTERTGKLTYSSVMVQEWGRWAGVAVRASIILGSAGFLVLYLIILGDLLVGSTQYSGIIPDLWPGLPDPLPWYLQRTAVLTWATLLVAPSLAPKTLGGVAPISVLKVTCSAMCVASLVLLCIALLIQGKLPAVHWLPDPSFFGDTFVERTKNILATLPVVLTACVPRPRACLLAALLPPACTLLPARAHCVVLPCRRVHILSACTTA